MTDLTHLCLCQKTFDLLIVGLGPAGVACALQAKRDGLDVLAIGDEPVGGLVRSARRLDNLPAHPGLSGAELAHRLERHLEHNRVSLVMGKVENLLLTGPCFEVEVRGIGKVTARAVCLATGTRPVEWTRDTGGKPVVRDARDLPGSMIGQDVVVVGGGEAALDTALSAKDRGASVNVLVRSDCLRSARGLIKEAQNAGIKIRTNCVIDRLTGGPGNWRICIEGSSSISAHYLVVCIGRVARKELLENVTEGELVADVVHTGSKGLFLAGDIIRGRERYVATAFGDGQRAAIEAFHYLKETNACWIQSTRIAEKS